MEVCQVCANMHKDPSAPGSMPWSYQGPDFKFATYTQDTPEPFLVQRAKTIRGIFPTLLIIFLGPIG